MSWKILEKRSVMVQSKSSINKNIFSPMFRQDSENERRTGDQRISRSVSWTRTKGGRIEAQGVDLWKFGGPGWKHAAACYEQRGLGLWKTSAKRGPIFDLRFRGQNEARTAPPPTPLCYCYTEQLIDTPSSSDYMHSKRSARSKSSRCFPEFVKRSGSHQ